MFWTHRTAGQRAGSALDAEDRDRLTELAVTAERNRIAREMHDIVAHNLSIMIALTDGAALLLEQDPQRALAAVSQAAATGRTALAEMQATFALLRTGVDESQLRRPEPMLSDIELLLERARSTGLQVTYHTSGAIDGLSTSLQLALFRLIQEGITNTLKHAPRATRLQVSVRRGQADLRIVVDDNGGTVEPSSVGQGLIGMRERVGLHDGRLFAGPTAHGWRISAWLPLNTGSGPLR